jgi:deferrochelatase/peroxidase EfeB
MTTPSIDYADVQGTILRGYRVELARHFILSVADAAAARAFIGNLIDGGAGLPRITTAARWTEKPECFVNISFTAPGLLALGVTQDQLNTFDASFVAGATNPAVAKRVGDTGTSDPSRWIGGLQDGAQVHVVLNLWVHKAPDVLERVTGQLRRGFAGALTELSAHEATALPDNRVHFNYRDNIAQPNVQGAPRRKHPDPDQQDEVPTGEFLLGYPNANNSTYSVQPAELSTNSSYAAFRILQQDAAGFEKFLQDFAPKAGIDPEMLAAKVCGRWRNGNPLELAPTGPGECLPVHALNDFNYVNKADASKDDTLGLVCPIGSHIRRNNPRNMAVVSTESVNHRIVRRAIPYGPAYDPQKPDDTPRGLIGYFINGSIKNQFEFLQGQWDLTPTFVMSATGPGGPADGNAVFNITGQDVFLGADDPSDSSFTLAALGQAGKNNTHVTGWPRMITTVGGAYVFLPSITGLRYLAALT